MWVIRPHRRLNYWNGPHTPTPTPAEITQYGLNARCVLLVNIPRTVFTVDLFSVSGDYENKWSNNSGDRLHHTAGAVPLKIAPSLGGCGPPLNIWCLVNGLNSSAGVADDRVSRAR